MDWLTFIAAIINSLAWPTAIVLLVFLLRHPLRHLLLLVRHFRVGGLEIDIGKEIEELEKAAERAKLPPSTEITPPTGDLLITGRAPRLSEMQLLHQIGDYDPRAAILASWIAVENEARAAASRKEINVSPRTPAISVIQKLMDAGHLSKEIASIVDRLRHLRNTAAHTADFSITTGEALEYLDLAGRIIAALRRVT